MTDGLNRINNPIAELQQRTAQKVFDLNNSGIISFIILKKIINIAQIELPNDVQ